MNTRRARIHFFSTTGNSRLAAEVVAAGLGHADWSVTLEDIRNPRLTDAAQPFATTEFPGFVFPIYAFRAAIPMEKHLAALPPAKVRTPVFLVATFAGYLDRAFMRLRDILLPKNYIPVITTTLSCEDSWPVARFPWLTFGNGRPDLAQLRALREFAQTSLPAAWERNRRDPQLAVDWVPFNPISVLAAMFPLAVGQGKQFPIFLKRSLCTRCGACVRQCPTRRLRLAPYPMPSGPCVGCYGCINTCPVDAINTWFTNQQPRYRGPTITIHEV